jgi:hypothetical protein
MKLSTAQKLVKFFSSKKKFEKIKQASLQWGFTCSTCNERSSIWEIGGIRYKAKGTPRTRIRCPKCDTIAMQRINKLA